MLCVLLVLLKMFCTNSAIYQIRFTQERLNLAQFTARLWIPRGVNVDTSFGCWPRGHVFRGEHPNKDVCLALASQPYFLILAYSTLSSSQHVNFWDRML